MNARTNPIVETLQTIHGYPDRLKIFKNAVSPFWWVRATFNERRITRSTKYTDKTKAVKFAKEFYETLLRNDKAIPLESSKAFARCAEALLKEHYEQMSTGERNPRFADDLRKQLTHRILPYFKNYPLRDIKYSVLNGFVQLMRKDKCSASTISRNLVSIRQVLKHAIKLALIDTLPVFPSVTTKDNPRAWFDEAEYKLLKKVATEAAEAKFTYKGETMTLEVRDFILFMVNTFLRPSDWYMLKRKQIRIQTRAKGEESILVIAPSSSKTVNTQIISMPNAVFVYQHIKERQDQWRIKKSLPPLDDEAYVFLPHISSRNNAKNLMRVFFNHILGLAKLKKAYTGAERTIYSLRHTAIAFRLLKGDNVDLLFLARNCRTSVDMLDRFYCRHLSAMMAPEKIVGFKAKRKTKAEQDE